MPRYELHRNTSGPEPRYRVPGIELFHPHKYPGSAKTGEPARDYTEADVDTMIAVNAKSPAKTFIGHNYPNSDAPERKIRGAYTNWRKEQREFEIDGKKVMLPTAVADLEDADPLMALNLVRGHYPHPSAEFSPTTMKVKGVAMLGARSPYFNVTVKPEANKALVDQIKADARDYALREDAESDDTALRDDLMSMGGGRKDGGDDATTESQKIERLTGVIAEQQKQINALLAEQAAIKDLAAIFKGGKNTSGSEKDKNMAVEKPADAAVRDEAAFTALREQNAALAVKIATLESERVKDAIRADITALRAKCVIADDTADAIIDVCAPIADAKARKAKFDALTKGLRPAPITDAAPEANTAIREGVAAGIADEKVRKLYTDAAAKGTKESIEHARKIKAEWDTLVGLREKHAESTWPMLGLGDAVVFVTENV